MQREVSKRTQHLLDVTSQAAAAAAGERAPGASPRGAHGLPGLAKEFATADKKSLDRLAALEAKYAGGDALPCLTIAPDQIAVGRFFNRFSQAFDAEQDDGFAALLADIRVSGGNLVPGLVRPTPNAALPYELVYGERRLRACAIAELGFKTQVEEFTDDQIAILHARENKFRLDPSVVESALQLRSWIELLGAKDGAVSREVAERVGGLFGFGGRYVYKMRRIAEVPADVLDIIPGIRRMSLRQAMTLADAWSKDAKGVRQRLEKLKSLPLRLPKEVIAYLSGIVTTPGVVSGTRSISIQWPTDAAKASALRGRLLELEKEFGLKLGLPKEV